jgi:hypothetical protein
MDASYLLLVKFVLIALVIVPGQKSHKVSRKHNAIRERNSSLKAGFSSDFPGPVLHDGQAGTVQLGRPIGLVRLVVGRVQTQYKCKEGIN